MVWLDNVRCDGSEDSLLFCSRSQWGRPWRNYHYYDISVYCPPGTYTYFSTFYRAMLCVSAVSVIDRYLSVCPFVCLSDTFMYCIQTAKDIVKLFSQPTVAPSFQFFYRSADTHLTSHLLTTLTLHHTFTVPFQAQNSPFPQIFSTIVS